MKTKILGTGLTGLVGSRIVELLSDKYEFESISYEKGIDITNKNQIEKIVINSPAGIVLHLAAKTDVDDCERDKSLGINGDAWKMNVEGTRNLVEACEKSGKKIIYISTDFVFDGNPPAGRPAASGYTEEDAPNPINWYAQTKYEGEKLIQSLTSSLICRIAFPYRANFPGKKDFVRGIMEKLKNGEKLTIVTDEIVTPTFIDDIALALAFLIKNKATGLYHVVGSSSQTPFVAAKMIAKIFNLDESLIGQTTKESYYSGRAPRPFSLALKNDKLTKLGFQMKTFKEGLEKVREQIKY